MAAEIRSVQIAEQALEQAEKVRDLRSLDESKRSDNYARELRDETAKLVALDAELDAVHKSEKHAVELQAWMDAEAERTRQTESRGGAATSTDLTGEVRTPGEQFTDSDDYREKRGRNVEAVEIRGFLPGDHLAGDGREFRNLLTGGSEGTSGSHNLVPLGSPFLAPQGIRMRDAFLRDLLSVQGTTLDTIRYVRELNALANEGGASAVSEASAKPEVTMTFESATAPVEKIAAWIQVTEEALEDAPTLRGYIDTRLAYMILVREEDQILNGTGTSPQIRGILQTTGVQTQAAVADDLAGTIGTAIGKVENVDGNADGIAINPVTFWLGVVERHSSQMDGSVLGGPLPFGAVPPGLFGLPVVRTRALATNKAVVGAWQLGATLFQRTATRIRTTDSHASLFISNTWVLLAEERIALAVHRPDFFVDTTLSFT